MPDANNPKINVPGFTAPGTDLPPTVTGNAPDKKADPTIEEAAEALALQLNGGKGLANDSLIARRFITICAVPRRSAFRVMNDKVLEERIENIGSSIGAKKALMQDAYMLAKYFPALTGTSYNANDFLTKVGAWLDNISVAVRSTGSGKTLDLSFKYDSAELMKEHEEKRDVLDAAYDKSEKGDYNKRKAALADYIRRLMTLELAKCHVGTPVELEQYVVWLHCLFYNDVCKEQSLLSDTPGARLFVKNEAKEKAQRTAKQHARRKALANYLAIMDNKDDMNEVVVILCANKNIPYQQILGKTETDIDIFLSKIANDEPELLNKVYNDPNKRLHSMIERAIRAGRLRKSDLNQQITDTDGVTIGSNMTEAIAYFKHPANKERLAKLNAGLNH